MDSSRLPGQLSACSRGFLGTPFYSIYVYLLSSHNSSLQLSVALVVSPLPLKLSLKVSPIHSLVVVLVHVVVVAVVAHVFVVLVTVFVVVVL